MDYTDLPRVKKVMDSIEDRGNPDLQAFITRASRLMDRLCTGQPGPSCIDYFKLEDVTDEILTNGAVDWDGRLTVWPHKPVINSVAALSYRYNLRDTYHLADLTFVSVEQEQVVFEGGLSWTEKCYVKISYNGGLGADVNALPDDFVDLATLMAIRLYREEHGGLGDSIGVAELGTMIYTKAFPERFINTLKFYTRDARWI